MLGQVLFPQPEPREGRTPCRVRAVRAWFRRELPGVPGTLLPGAYGQCCSPHWCSGGTVLRCLESRGKQEFCG